MGTVYRAYDHLEQTLVALKRVKYTPDDLIFNSKSTYGDAKVAILQEFRTLASLRHPGIISVLDYGFDHDRTPFFTMTLLDHVETIVDCASQLNDADKAGLLIQTLQALIYLHRRNILHRDLKPANILVSENGEVKVLDFGLATTAMNSTGSAGTLTYMAPEVLQYHQNSRLADLYSVGMIAYELFVGVYPFETTNPIKLIRQICDVMPDTSMLENTQLANVLDRWLLKDPEDRYQTPNEIIIALCHALDIAVPDESIAIRESFLQAGEFVGRDSELKILKNGLRQILDGRNHFYLVGGESGIGKSRLLDELRIVALVSGASVMQGRAIISGAPFQLWRNIVRRLILQSPIDDQQASILREIIPDIANLLDREVTPLKQSSAGDIRQLILSTIINLIRDVKQPLVILLEDLQWVEGSLTPLIELMKIQDQLSHVMIVASYRDDEASHLPQTLPDFSVIELDRLDKQAIQSLSESMLGTQGANDKIVKLLHTETEGNLFFLVETVRALAEAAGGLENINITTLPQHIFTGGMQQIAQFRLRKIADAYTPIQSLAAIIGREIDTQLLTVHFPQKQVNDWVTNAIDVAVLTIDENEWLFAHDKFREAILLTLSDEDKQALHHQAALAIESVYPDQEDYYLLLLNHWRMAQDLTREAYYLQFVAERLIRFEANYEDASTLLMDFLERCPPQAPYRNRILNLAGQLKRRQHDLDTALVYLQDVLDNNPTPDETLDALENIAAVEYFQGDVSRAIETWQKLLRLSRQYGNDVSLLAAMNNIGFAAFQKQDYETAKDYFLQCLEVHRTAPDLDVFSRTNTLQNLGFASLYLQDYATARSSFLEALNHAYLARIIPLILTALTGITHLEALFGDKIRATQWAGAIGKHPALRPETRSSKLKPILTLLESELIPEHFEENFTDGATIDIITLAQTLIDEMT